MADRRCSVEGCEKPLYARGWCQHHYNIWYKHGDPLWPCQSIPPLIDGALERIRYPSAYDAVMAKVERDGDCLIFIGATDSGGYGTVTWSGQKLRTSRIVAEHHLGPPPPDKPHVLHSCDNPPCVEIDHLRYGTHPENMQEMMLRGRWYHAHGVGNGKAKLTPWRVNLVRQRHAAGETLTSIARSYEVDPSTLSRLVSGELWGSVRAKRVLRRPK